MQLRGLLPANFDLVDKKVTILVDKELKELKPIFTKLFRKISSQKPFERTVSFAEFGDVPLKPEGEEYATDLIQQAWTKDVSPLEWGLMFEISETAQEDDIEKIIVKYSKLLAFSMRQVEEKTAALVFENGFSTQVTADTVALYSTAHTLKRGGTAKNRPSSDADFSVTSLAQAFTDLDTDTKSEGGHIMMANTGFWLLHHPANRFNVARILKSTLMPGEANNDINPVKDLDITPVMNPFLTDTDAWYLVPKNKESNGLVFLERIPVYQPAPMTDARTGNRLYKIRARETWDSIDWRHNYGNPGA